MLQQSKRCQFSRPFRLRKKAFFKDLNNSVQKMAKFLSMSQCVAVKEHQGNLGLVKQEFRVTDIAITVYHSGNWIGWEKK